MDDRTGEHELRRLLAANCKGSYGDEISEFALVLRVAGNQLENAAAAGYSIQWPPCDPHYTPDAFERLLN